jgi:AbrB family looped-hinge helix DNA binding protein
MKSSKNAVVDRFGRIVIPKDVRDDLGIEAGTVLSIEERGDEIVLNPLRQGPYLKEIQGVLVYTGSALSDLSSAERRSRSKHIQRLSGWKNRK